MVSILSIATTFGWATFNIGIEKSLLVLVSPYFVYHFLREKVNKHIQIQNATLGTELFLGTILSSMTFGIVYSLDYVKFLAYRT